MGQNIINLNKIIFLRINYSHIGFKETESNDIHDFISSKNITRFSYKVN